MKIILVSLLGFLFTAYQVECNAMTGKKEKKIYLNRSDFIRIIKEAVVNRIAQDEPVRVIWKIQQRNVCFEPKGDKFGKFTMKDGGILNGFKLVHKSGYVACHRSGLSFWGCGGKAISIAITDTYGNILFPNGLDSRGWVTLPGYTSISSQLQLNKPKNHHTYVVRGKVIKLWYGEDLKSFTESDNHGRACVDVYADVQEWKLQQRNVCFESKGNNFGMFTMKDGGILKGFKLVHKLGYLACHRRGLSFWGCGGKAISIAITDAYNNILFPYGLDSRGWVTLPGYTSLSFHLQLDKPRHHHMNVVRGKVIRLWYGEDLKSFTESDNHGRACVDVYADVHKRRW